jgi:hypothetical protein
MTKKAKFLPIFLLSVAAMATLIGLSARSVSAQSNVAGAVEGLQITPVIVEQSKVQKGSSYSVPVTLTNVTSQDHTYYAAVNDFTSQDETGSPRILLDSTLPDAVSIRTWVSVVKQVTIKANQAIIINVQINIPTNAESGGHYGTLRFSGVAPTPQSAGIGLSASTGMLFLISVDGNITEKASVASFTTATTDDKATGFFEKAPLNLVVRIKNEGNVHVKPFGQILVHDMFGGLVATLPVNDQKSNVLPSSIRRFDITLNNSWMFGHYTADLALGYGTSGQAMTATTDFWIIPYKLVLVVLLALATITFILVRMVRVYNKRIITKAIQKHDQKTSSNTKK